MSLLRPVFSLLMALLFVAGCAGMDPDDGPTVGEVDSPRIQAAGAALAAEDPSSALTLLRLAAAETAEPAATGLQLEAALLALMVDDNKPAREWLGARYADTGEANAAISAMVRVHLGELEGQDAIRALTPTRNRDQLPPRLIPFQLDTLATLEAEEGHWRQALDYRLAMAEHSPPGWFQRLNEARLWEALVDTPLADLREVSSHTTADPLRGWLDLAITIREQALEPNGAALALESWRIDQPTHPASSLFETRVIAMQRAALSPPAHIGVLLPLTGELGSAGRAIQRGILAAYHADTESRRRPELFFVDTGDEGMPAPAAYREAVARGALQVIGPLTKGALRDLIAGGNLDIPVLALNRVDDVEVPPTVYQFGLGPEDDARAAAALALSLGYQRMAILSSADDWGTRVATAFSAQLEENGGQVLGHARYADDQDDMSAPVRELFHLDLSTERRDRLQSVTGLRVHFDDRRREDIDAVFLGAFETNARVATPQIRFQRGLNLPVLATSQAYPHNASRQANEDLEGVMIMRMPWLLEGSLPPRIEAARGQLAGAGGATRSDLVALGIDAFQILGPLTIMQREPALRGQGSTGAAQLGPDNEVRRSLLPTRVTRSGLRPLRLPESDGPPSYLP